MNSIPAPDENDRPLNQPETVTLDPGERATVSYEAHQRTGGGFVLPILGMTKHPDSIYKATVDGSETIYNESAVPPTDVDDKTVTFAPAYSFDSSLTCEITNLSDARRRYTVQPIGFEKTGGGE
ncbi:hypothetical protein [Halorubrum sp. DTA46]|uniref:hypothetical protein n=1 Tax=Halorubrum sp. DTA46 TaxID=3402162 RepID=UPI003AAA6702